MKIVFGEPDKMFSLTAEALSPTARGPEFLSSFFLTECSDGPQLLRDWAARHAVPHNLRVTICEDENQLSREAVDADVLIVEKQPVTSAIIDKARNLKLVQVYGRRTDTVDRSACEARNITLCLLDRHTNRMVAEQIVMSMLMLLRRVDETRAAMQRSSSLPPSGWAYNWPACREVRGLSGLTIGLIGFGETAQVLADILRSFNVNIVYTRRNRDLGAEREFGAAFCDLDAVLASSDIVSVHVPGGADTRHLIKAEHFARMKPGALFINTARGSVVDEVALAQAIRSGHLGGAALDVFETEPLPLNHPLQSLPNVILTPHIGAGSRDSAWLDRELGPVVEPIVRLAANR